MTKKMNSLICGVLTVSVVAGTVAGCSDSGNSGSATVPLEPTTAIITDIASDTDTEPSATTVPDDQTLPEKGEINGMPYEILENTDQTTFRERGVYASPNEYGDMTLLIICSGEKNTGGYDIRIADIGIEDGDTLKITVEETSPDPDMMVTQALTYPCCRIKIAIDESIKEAKILNTQGDEFEYYDAAATFSVEDGYIAVLHDGVGERTRETYVYKDENGYRYVNTTSTTVSWGSPQWNVVPDDSGTCATKEEILQIAQAHSSAGFVTFPGDMTGHPVEDFLNGDF